MTGMVFDVRRFSLHDGPGIRTTVFLKGCPLSCAWCHNPESQSPGPVTLVRSELCLRCWRCVDRCPQGALSRADAGVAREASRCVGCGGCAEVCPAEATVRVGEEREAADVADEILRDRLFFDESGGGVTVSGGEPLAQPAFLFDLLARCGWAGVHRAVDTSGHAPAEVALEAARRAELLLFDVKLVDEAAHLRYTGVSNAGILRNLRLVSETGVALEVRMPMIPGVTDTPENLDAAVALFRSLGRLPPVRLLGHHHASTAKYRRFGMEAPLGELPAPAPARLAELAARLRREGIDAVV